MEPTAKLLYTQREAAQLSRCLSAASITSLQAVQLPLVASGERVLIHRDAIERFARQDHFAIRERKTARPAESLEDRRAG